MSPELKLDQLEDVELQIFTGCNFRSGELKICYKGVNDTNYWLTPEDSSYETVENDSIKDWKDKGWKFVKPTQDEESWVIQCYLQGKFVSKELAIAENPYDLKLGEYYRVTNEDSCRNEYPSFVTICRVESLVKSGPKICHCIDQASPLCEMSEVEFKEEEQFPHYDWVKCKFQLATWQERQWLKDSIGLGKLAKKPPNKITHKLLKGLFG